MNNESYRSNTNTYRIMGVKKQRKKGIIIKKNNNGKHLSKYYLYFHHLNGLFIWNRRILIKISISNIFEPTKYE